MSAAGDTEMSLNEFLQFLGEPPDILLEKELVWPVEPDLMYWCFKKYEFIFNNY